MSLLEVPDEILETILDDRFFDVIVEIRKRYKYQSNGTVLMTLGGDVPESKIRTRKEFEEELEKWLEYQEYDTRKMYSKSHKKKVLDNLLVLQEEGIDSKKLTISKPTLRRKYAKFFNIKLK